MSHLPERNEKICLNCKTVVYGRFCHICGQENLEPKETLWGLITHFVYDLTHFDGKFFDTARYLLFRPGYLAYEYLRGRRASYLNPLRMYIFTSAFFFILFFSFLRNPDPNNGGAIKIEEDSISTRYPPFGKGKFPLTVKAYDSLQQLLPSSERNNQVVDFGMRKMISINEQYDNKGNQFWRDANEKFMHSIPQMMFVSLPLVALILQLLYIRRKQYFYVNHLIFTVNLYIAVYLLLLAFYAFDGLSDLTGSGIFTLLRIITLLSIFIYTYKGLRNFYRQRRAKTIIKFLIFLFSFLVLMLLLMVIYFFTSALQIS